MMLNLKNLAIKETISATRERRAGMLCRVFEVKVIRGKLSREKKKHLDALFREAKWLRNSELSKNDIALLDRNAKTAVVKVGNDFEVRVLTHLGSQMRQDVVDQLKSDIRGLSVLKEHGYKVGRLKFKSFCNSVPLRQYGVTYRIDFAKSTISIQCFKKPFRVRGLKQIPADAEIANAKLIRKPSGYYFHITTYTVPKEHEPTGALCGTDFGIKTNLTTSDGDKLDISVPESHAVKLASKELNRSYKRNGSVKSKNHRRRQDRLRRAYERQNNQKADKANKVVRELLENYDIVAIQDEMIAGWHRGVYGKQVQHSAMGTIKSKLKHSSKTIVVPRSFPSTQKCPACGRNTKHPLSKRDYDCGFCGYHHPSRDVKAAQMVLSEALEIASNYTVSPERRTKSPVELSPSGFHTDSPFADCMVIKVPALKQEAQVL